MSRARRPSIRDSKTGSGRARISARSFYPSGSYDGARGDLREFSGWSPLAGGPHSDTLGDLPSLRARARDLVRNAPVATSARQTTVLGVIGPGLSVQPRIDRAFLRLTDAEADAFEAQAQRIWWAAAYGTPFDIERRQTFDILTRKAFASAWDNGDMFVVRRYAQRPRDLLGTKLQLVEADRCMTPDGKEGDGRFFDGVEVDESGAVAAYHFADKHPGERMGLGGFGLVRKWNRIPAYDQFGERNVLHVTCPVSEERIGALRGIPALAPAMRLFKQTDRYTNAEVMAAVVAAMFTVFVTQEKDAAGDNMLGQVGTDEENEDIAETNYRLDHGAIYELMKGQSIETANPGRPNANYGPFITSMLEQMGTSVQIPFELLMRRFQASYSASKAAIELAWAAFRMMRSWFNDDFTLPIYEWVIVDAILSGHLNAPGFFADPLIRNAYCACEVVGPPKPVIDEVKEITAAKMRIAANLSTHQRETQALTSADWGSETAPQLGKERQRIVELGLSDEETSERIRTEPVQPTAAEEDEDEDETGDLETADDAVRVGAPA